MVAEQRRTTEFIVLHHSCDPSYYIQHVLLTSRLLYECLPGIINRVSHRQTKCDERERAKPIGASVRTTEILSTWYYALAVFSGYISLVLNHEQISLHALKVDAVSHQTTPLFVREEKRSERRGR